MHLLWLVCASLRICLFVSLVLSVCAKIYTIIENNLEACSDSTLPRGGHFVQSMCMVFDMCSSWGDLHSAAVCTQGKHLFMRHCICLTFCAVIWCWSHTDLLVCLCGCSCVRACMCVWVYGEGGGNYLCQRNLSPEMSSTCTSTMQIFSSINMTDILWLPLLLPWW